MLYLETKKNGTLLGQKQQREKGKCWSMWWKKWTNNRVWEKKRTRVVGGLLNRHRAVNAATCSSQINRTPPFLPLLLDRLFSVEENRSPPPPPLPLPGNRNRRKENVGRLTNSELSTCVLFCFGPSVCCFPRRWPETVKSSSVSERSISVQPRLAHNGQVYLPSTRLST